MRYITPMDQRTKIQLSKEQRNLIKNTDWIFSKRLILKKAESLLTQVQQQVQKTLEEKRLPFVDPLLAQRSKIARGENYKGLPWLMLDYPATFEKTGILAVRTMFWWGNYFSCTLHVSGKYMPAAGIRETWMAKFAKEDYYLAAGNDEWVHDLSPDAYCKATGLSARERLAILNKPFFKAATRFPVDDFSSAQEAIPKSICFLMETLTSSNAMD